MYLICKANVFIKITLTILLMAGGEGHVFFHNGFQNPPSVFISIYIVRGEIAPPIPAWIWNKKKNIWFTDMQKHPSSHTGEF